jgi:hypothetical protein
MLRSGDRNDNADRPHIVKSFSLHLTGCSRAFFSERVSAYRLTARVPENASKGARNGLKLKPSKQERLGDDFVTVSATLTERLVANKFKSVLPADLLTRGRVCRPAPSFTWVLQGAGCAEITDAQPSVRYRTPRFKRQ